MKLSIGERDGVLRTPLVRLEGRSIYVGVSRVWLVYAGVMGAGVLGVSRVLLVHVGVTSVGVLGVFGCV